MTTVRTSPPALATIQLGELLGGPVPRGPSGVRANLVIASEDTLRNPASRTLTRAEIRLETPSLGRALTSRELSDGTLRFLCLAAALLSDRPPELLALNEPETSLHPRSDSGSGGNDRRRLPVKSGLGDDSPRAPGRAGRGIERVPTDSSGNGRRRNANHRRRRMSSDRRSLQFAPGVSRTVAGDGEARLWRKVRAP